MRCPRQREASALQARCLEGEKTKQAGQLTTTTKKKQVNFWTWMKFKHYLKLEIKGF